MVRGAWCVIPHTQTVCALDPLLLLQLYADRFETVRVFLSWSEDVHVIQI